jgi:pimeloyl-ACP methyl ester carboxylesterase
MVTASDNFITVEGIKLQYTEFGSRSNPHVLCLHGFSLEAHSWDELAERMSMRYHIVCPSVPGHGGSSRRESYDDPFADIHLIAAFMDQLGMASATVLGHSMGGVYGGGLAVFHPQKVERLVMVDSGLDTRAPGAAHFQAYVDAWQPEHASLDEAKQWARERFRDTPERSIESWTRHGGEVSPDGRFRWKLDPVLMNRGKSPQPEQPDESPFWPFLLQIKCPVLIARGENSDLLRAEIVERMVQTLPDGRSTEARSVGHGMHYQDPDAVYQAIKEFLELP